MKMVTVNQLQQVGSIQEE